MIRIARWEVFVSLICTFVLGLVVALILVTVASAQGGTTRARYTQTSGSGMFPKKIVVVCQGWAEDSAAHLKLVSFEDEKVVYRCLWAGY